MTRVGGTGPKSVNTCHGTAGSNACTQSGAASVAGKRVQCMCTLTDSDRPRTCARNEISDVPLPAFKPAVISGGATNELQYPSWQKPLQQALYEPDLQKLFEKLSAAESAIFVRMQELTASSDGHKESKAVRLACKEILKIQTKRLKWPISDGMLSDCTE